MTRKRKLFYNTFASLIYQLITIIVGFILPRIYLRYFGSDVNGLMHSITQFLGFITLCHGGVGMVVQSALYKPLAENDEDQVSRIVISSEKFFKKIGYILCGYVALLVAVYPLTVKKSFGFIYTALMVVIISISSFAQYYFGITNRFLLNADQLSFVQLTIDSIGSVLNTVFIVILVKLNCQIHFIRLVTSLVYILQVFSLQLYVKKHYKINRDLVLEEEPIKQKWNGLAQHIAAVVLNNTDVAVLTLFSSLKNVSVYSVYSMVVNGVKAIINAFTTGLQALFGNMLAKKEMQILNKTFSVAEWLMHTGVTLCFTLTYILIIPFVKVYTNGITDTNYIKPLFAAILTLAQAIYCIRLPYNMMILAAGHYKETQTSSIIEAVLNVVLSVGLVFKLGLTGVAIGTFVAMLYRTVYLAVYLSKNILNRDIKLFIKQTITDILSAFLIIVSTSKIELKSISYKNWILMSLKSSLIAVMIVVIINAILFRENLINVKKIINKRIKAGNIK